MNQVNQEIHSLETIKEYKQENYDNVKKISTGYNKQDKAFKTNHKKTKAEISQSKKRCKSLAEEYFKMMSMSGGYSSPIALDLEEGNTKVLQQHLIDIEDDIALLKEKRIEANETLAKINDELEQIDIKIAHLKKQKKNKKYGKNKSAGTTTVDCPKICTIGNIKIKCGDANRSFTLDVPPYHQGNDVPSLHVLSGSDKTVYDIIDVDFSGSCDHGKLTSSDNKDNEKHKLFNRNSDNSKYCPKVKIINGDSGTDIHQPSQVKFAAALPKNSYFDSKELKIFKDLIFDEKTDTQDYDLQFNSCTGAHPYKARIIAYPKWSWKFDMEFGYKQSTKIQDSAYSQEDSLLNKFKYVFTSKPESYDDLESNGGWEAVIKANYTYDSFSNEYSKTLSLKGLAKELQADWGFLTTLEKFYGPINGFFELADYKAKDSGDGKVADSDSIATITVDWTKIVMSGGAASEELTGKAEVGVKGTFSIGFEPLFGLTGTLNVMQLMLTTLGGGFGVYLNKVSNMSLGSKDKQGKLDTDKTHVKTNLKLNLTANASIGGSLAFESTDETLWKAAKGNAKVSSGKDGASQVTGFIGLMVEGDASISGLIWDVRFASGAMFKTASEDGSKPSGVEASLKPIIINSKYSAAGYLMFTGLSVIYAVYAKVEGAGLANKSSGDENENMFDDDETETKDAFEQKNVTKHILFKKRKIGSLGDDTISLGA